MANDGRFKKGAPPGPGRPVGSGRVLRCKAWADKYGFGFLEAVAAGKPVQEYGIKVPVTIELRIDVTQYLIDKGYGKTPHAVNISAGAGVTEFTLRMGNSESA